MTERRDQGEIRVIIVDDHPMLRNGTRTWLEGHSGITVVGMTGEGRAVLPLVERLRPNVLILDILLPDLSGVEVARQVRAAYPEVAILVVTGHENAGYARVLLQLGVHGYLGKTASGEQLLAAVRTIAQGGTAYWSDTMTTVFVSGANTLTTRECEVLRLLVAGWRNNEIAEELCMSVSTVEYHVSKLLRKLGVRSRTEAVRKSHEQGLVLPESGSVNSA